MATTYEYTYDYDVQDSKGGNNNNRNQGNRTQRTAGHQSNHSSHAPLHRPSGMDPLFNLQHDRIWNKLYDPLNTDKSGHETEAQV